jgi:hypothetical protein
VTGLGAGPYGFDVIILPAGQASIQAYTGTVPVYVKSADGYLGLSQSEWGDGSGDSKICIWAQEDNVSGGTQYFDAAVTNAAITVGPDNLLYNPGFELGDTGGWTTHAGGSVSAQQTTVYEGSYAGQMNGGARSQTYISIARELKGVMNKGETYTISCWARLGSGSGAGTLAIKTVDGSGTSYPAVASAALNSTSWTRIAAEYPFDYTGTLSSALLYLNAPIGETLQIDNAAVTLYKPPNGIMFIVR